MVVRMGSSHQSLLCPLYLITRPAYYSLDSAPDEPLNRAIRFAPEHSPSLDSVTYAMLLAFSISASPIVLNTPFVATDPIRVACAISLTMPSFVTVDFQ